MSKTMEDLQEAFAGESQANRRYLAFAKKADEEGYHQVARLFRAAAHAETVHALSHLRALGAVNETAANLQAAISGENYEVMSMYPGFMEDAQNENDAKALKSFRHAFEVEKVHEALYRGAAANLGQEAEDFAYYVCPVCGYTEARNAPERCPVCGMPGSKFEKID